MRFSITVGKYFLLGKFKIFVVLLAFLYVYTVLRNILYASILCTDIFAVRSYKVFSAPEVTMYSDHFISISLIGLYG
jgi:hypothetical protein